MNYRKKAILMVVALFCLNIAMLAQAVSLKMNNVSVKEAMTQLKNKSGYSFVYKVGDLDTKKIVNVKAKQLIEAIDQILYGQNVVYEVKGKNIIVQKGQPRPKEVKDSKKRKITGVVNDQNGEPIIGATVKEKGGVNGTATDLDAKFALEVSPGAVLEISYIGYQTQEVKVGDRTALAITLIEDQQVLDEVVVVGYGTTSRKNLTTAIATVKTDKISKAANSSVASMLLGRAAGLQATVNSTQPGGEIKISIRGGENPIYVVDGVVMPNSSLEVGSGDTGLPDGVKRAALAGLNPSDIESIEVLKDASAAIYGIGAADGVILITTKKGAEGKPHITYEGSYSIQKRYSYGMNRLNSQEYMNMVNLFGKENYLYVNEQYPYGNVGYDGKWTPIFTSEQIANATTTDWLSYVLKTGQVNNQNLTISGGSKAIRYYLGLNYYDEDGIVRNAGMQRYSLRTNISAQLFSFLKLTTIANLNHNKYSNSTVGGDTGNRSDSAAGSLYTAMNYPTYLPMYDNMGKYTIFNREPNPLAALQIRDQSKQSSYYVNFALDLDIIKNMLSAKLLYGVNKENGKRSAYIPKDVYWGLFRKSRGSLGYNERQYETMEGTLSFRHKFWNIIDVNAVAGIGRYLDKGTGMTVSYQNANDMINDSNLAAADGPFSPTSYKYENEKRSQFLRASFDILDRYVLTATLRRDGTDKFFPDKKYSLFPSASVAWKLSNESFMQNLSWLNLLKVRASYGMTGSDNLRTSLYGIVGISREDIKFSNSSVTYVPYALQSANYSDVTWQKTTMKNIGLDFSILKDRIWGSLDVFRNDVTNLLDTAPTSLLNMYGYRPVNGGHYKRTGVELSLNTLNIQTPNFKWTSSLALSHYNACWIERMPNFDYKKYQKRENEPKNAYYYYKMVGVINEDRSNMPDSQRSLPREAQLPGYPIIDDRNGDGKIDINDIYMDNTLPKVYYGFGNTFAYKNFDLDIYMYGQLGVKKFNSTHSTNCSAANLASGILAANPTDYAYSIWNSQTNPNGEVPGIAYKSVTLPENAPINAFWEKASFLRVRNITLGYNWDARKLAFLKGNVQNIRLFVDFQNPFTLTKFEGDDPEIATSAGNLGHGQYPQLRVYSFGAKISF
ncbi:SusC/RagA family TonB-linked outer membrane protein [Bacteroides acidifaciens]|uniref:SusC/RagA family TonB-linked outer membrane protein n=1 Tax=Bacteroides acidifaciens TaxID=85831 RepID=UPI00242F5BEA|nr:SusC/RagA family TonB-linked outer membrane protein [Bacteroides acidifaciens]